MRMKFSVALTSASVALNFNVNVESKLKTMSSACVGRTHFGRPMYEGCCDSSYTYAVMLGRTNALTKLTVGHENWA